MRKIIHRIVLFSLGIIFLQPSYGQEEEYKHPLYDIGFMASASWEQELHNYNGKVFEVTNPNNNMRISLSFVPDCRNTQKHMRRMSGLKGLVCPDRPYDTILNNKKAVIMQGMCLKGMETFRRLVVGIPNEQGLYLMEFCCPEDSYLYHQSQMRSILSSLRVGV